MEEKLIIAAEKIEISDIILKGQFKEGLRDGAWFFNDQISTDYDQLNKSMASTQFSYYWTRKINYDGDNIVGIDSENNLLLFSKDKEFDPVIVQFEELNLELQDFEEKRILNLLGWTN